MNRKLLTARITNLAIVLTTVLLALLPFHAFLTVWLSSGLGHYTALRLWKEVILLLLVVAASYQLWCDKAAWLRFKSATLNKLIVGYLAVITISGVVAHITNHVTLKALGYGLIVDSRFLVFFLVISVFASYGSQTLWLKEHWPKLLLWPAVIVAVFGLLQYFVLPHDFLRHFGYSQATIYPYETINHDLHRIRVMSTLRGANPLGAYLLLVLCLTTALWLKHKRRWLLAFGALVIVVLGLTFSRSAWIGAVLAAGILVVASVHTERGRRLAIGSAGSLIIVAVIAGLALHHNTAFQDAILHTDDKSTIATSSNQGHASALRTGLREVVHAPIGEGTGTAGPASVYNNGKVRIAENYFIQVAQETGWLGGLLFILIQVCIGRELWRKRSDSLALGLLAALVGLSFVNLLSHAWADDTLAYVFWGLVAIALIQVTPNKLSKSTKPTKSVRPPKTSKQAF